ncbi:DUF1365 domain-containing protein [Thioalkalivibrio sp. ALJT]|uniref:DUF1365 domain-containing protein n=1 Tax=Thioalkalivibrio sp. ALJT TaxID=1158146 RepID=UPI0003625CF0|nr:DUF1365 domain-containing protein [Thioalkalivibrio sp. ALJT]
MSIRSHLYDSVIMHARYTRGGYRFRYRVFHFLLDIDRLDALASELRLFSHNRFNLFSFRDRDHGPRDGSPLRPWIEARLARAGIDIGGGHVGLLCFPRLLGYAFNPLSLWFCHYPDGRPAAVLCEVRNTFGEYHHYVLAPPADQVFHWASEYRKTKKFHVSPFLGMDAEYRFRIARPRERLSVRIAEYTREERVLFASMSGKRHALDDRALIVRFLRMPLMTFRVVFSIHWQALKLWWRGVPFHKKPAPPRQETD